MAGLAADSGQRPGHCLPRPASGLSCLYLPESRSCLCLLFAVTPGKARSLWGAVFLSVMMASWAVGPQVGLGSRGRLRRSGLDLGLTSSLIQINCISFGGHTGIRSTSFATFCLKFFKTDIWNHRVLALPSSCMTLINMQHLLYSLNCKMGRIGLQGTKASVRYRSQSVFLLHKLERKFSILQNRRQRLGN